MCLKSRPRKSCSARNALVILPRNRDRSTAQPFARIGFVIRRWTFGVRRSAFSDDNRPVAVSHAGSARQQRILVANIGVSVDGDSGNMQLAANRPFIKRLDILEAMLKPVSAQSRFCFSPLRKT